MPWSVLKFGKHEGKTLPQVVFADPDWFFWALEEGAFDNRGPVFGEAIELAKKARSIRIPNNDLGNLHAEYLIAPVVGGVAGMHIVPADQPVHQGGSRAIRRPVIDLSIARQISSYDKLGGALLIADVKRALFGSSTWRMTRQRCEAFFENLKNFSP